MTAAEAYELISGGGAKDFAGAVEVCESLSPWCLIGDAAVNLYTEPMYTIDAEFIVASKNLPAAVEDLRSRGFASQLRIQFTTDMRYQDFLSRAVGAVVLGIPVKVACLEDTTQGKLWAYSDTRRRFSKRKKDELDLIRLAEAWPELRKMYPPQLLELIDRGQHPT